MTQDLTPEEKAEWLEDARDAIHGRMKTHGITPVQAVDQLSTQRAWRSGDAAEILQEALARIIVIIDGADGDDEHGGGTLDDNAPEGGWYEGPDLKNDTFWPPVRKAILDQLDDDALEKIDKSSNRIVGRAGLPDAQKLKTRGLVVGFVQSGKTTNFLSVIAKAADEGYRLIIVLAGMTNSLREQTQERLLDSLVSYTQKDWLLLTGKDRDFSGSDNGDRLLNDTERQLVVIKKNGPRLKKLNKWLDGIARKHGQLNFPILVIDDEADQASVNVMTSAKEKNRRSAINTQIGALLDRPRTSYIAYTATPFANILIDPNDESDLYPENFISVLPRPEGYFGAEQLFGRDAVPGEDPETVGDTTLDAIREILPDEVDAVRPPNRGIASWTPDLPDSLRDAVRWFLLATATRWARGQRGKHSSMLVHSSPRIQAHESLANTVGDAVNDIVRSMVSAEFRTEIEEYWNRENSLQPQNDEYPAVSFDEVWHLLHEVLDEVKVIVDNGQSDERLDYSRGAQTVIAVGGNTLSRGLTLEGLVCSYFARVSRTYDTLLQMGRWFGFRHGYEDLVRIWMTSSLAEWFRDLATVEADLRRDINQYADTGLTPADFRAKIRLHPAMQVTSAAKMRNHKNASMSFSGQRVQTILFREQDPEFLGHNIAVTREFITGIRDACKDNRERDSWERSTNGSTVFTGISSEEVITYLTAYRFIEDDEEKPYGKSRWDLLIDYITKEGKTEGIRKWNVSVIGKKTAEKTIDLGLKHPLALVRRTRVSSSTPGRASINTLVGPRDRINDLPFHEQDRWKALEDKFAQHKGGTSDAVLRAAHDEHAGPRVGHLTIYAIDKESTPLGKTGEEKDPGRARRALEAVDDVIALGVFLPESPDEDSGVGYICGVDKTGPVPLTEDEMEELRETQAEYEDTVDREDAADEQDQEEKSDEA